MSARQPRVRDAAAPSAFEGEPLAADVLAGPLDDLVLASLPDQLPAFRPADVERSPRIGVAFGAGGVLGNAYLAGVVAAIHDATGFEPRTAAALVGTSAGSVHAALYGSGMPALFGLWRNRGGRMPEQALREIGAAWSRVEGRRDDGEGQTLREIFAPARHLPKLGPASKSLALRTLLRPWAYRPEIALSGWLPEGMLTNAAVGQALRRVIPSGWAPHPRTWVVAVNLRTGRREVFGAPGAPRAHLDQAVQASCAIPGFYRPIRVGRDRYVDGGMHSPSNADLLARLELDLALVLNPMSSLEGHASAGFVDRYLYPLRRIASRHLQRELAALAEAGIPTLVIQPTARDLAVFSRNLMDPRPRKIVAETAVETARDALSRPESASALALLRIAGERASLSA